MCLVDKGRVKAKAKGRVKEKNMGIICSSWKIISFKRLRPKI